MKKFLIATGLSLALITSSSSHGLANDVADNSPSPNTEETIINENAVKDLAKRIADMIYLFDGAKEQLEAFGKEIEKELEKKRKNK